MYSYQGGDGKAFLWIHVNDGILTASSDDLLVQLKSVFLASLIAFS